MTREIDSEFRIICENIIDENRSISEWKEIEADDYIQTEHYEGGFDADEEEFCFSLYENNQEYWFQLSLNDIRAIVDGTLNTITVEVAD